MTLQRQVHFFAYNSRICVTVRDSSQVKLKFCVIVTPIRFNSTQIRTGYVPEL